MAPKSYWNANNILAKIAFAPFLWKEPMVWCVECPLLIQVHLLKCQSAMTLKADYLMWLEKQSMVFSNPKAPQSYPSTVRPLSLKIYQLQQKCYLQVLKLLILLSLTPRE